MDDLDRLTAQLNGLEAMPALGQAAALAGLIDQMPAALSARRGAVLAALTAQGAAYYRRIPLLAHELKCHRSRIDEALAAHRAATRAE